MKKILAILSSVLITSTFSSTVVSCTNSQTNNINYDLLIGKSISKENAIDDSKQVNENQLFSNFYTLGDSLSDTGGLMNIISEQINSAKKILDDPENEEKV